MANPQLEQYIAEAKQKGMTDEVMRQELAKAGWMSGDIDAVLGSATPLVAPTAPSVTESAPASAPAALGMPVSKNKFILTAIFLGAVVLASGASAYFFLGSGSLGLTGFLSKPPYSTDTFLSEMAAHIGTITSAMYTVSATAESQPRNPEFKSLREVFPEFIPAQQTGYAAKASEPLITSMIRTEDIYASFIPSEMNAQLSITGTAKRAEAGTIKPSGSTGVTVSFSTPDFSMNADVEIVVHEGVVYGKINRMPTIVVFNFDAIKGKWVKIGDTADEQMSAGGISVGLTSDEAAKMFDVLKQTPKLADESRVITYVQTPHKETLDSKTVYRYDLKLNPENFLRFYDSLTPLLRDATPEERRKEFDQVTAEQRAVISDPTFVRLINHLQEHTLLSVWVSQDSKLPVKAASTGYLIPSSTAAQSGQSISPVQLKMTFSVALSEINRPIAVSAPSEFITLDEAYSLLYPQKADLVY